MKNCCEYLITLALILTFIFSPLLTNKASAFLGIADYAFSFETNPALVVSAPVSATANTITAYNTTLQSPVKEFALDTIAWMLVNVIIERLAASTVNWINSGFRGSPAFVTDPETYFRNIGDQVAGQLIYNHPDLRLMCAPLRAKVQIALTQNYIQPFYYQCTLGQIVNNFDNFMNDFNQGGWDGFIEVSQRSQNNPLGLYNQLQNEMNIRISSSFGQKQQELSQGRGFLSWKSCGQWSEPSPGYTSEARIGVTGLPEDEVDNQFGEIPAREVAGVPAKCIKEQVNTPGSVIETQLNSVLGLGNSRLQVADEINEMISALLNQLAARIVGGVGKGLRSLGGRGSGSDGGTYFEQLRNASLTNIIPMPPSRKCPDYYVAISESECGTNDLIRKSFTRAREAEAATRAAIEESRRNAQQNLPQDLPSLPCTGEFCPLPETQEQIAFEVEQDGGPVRQVVEGTVVNVIWNAYSVPNPVVEVSGNGVQFGGGISGNSPYLVSVNTLFELVVTYRTSTSETTVTRAINVTVSN